MFYFSLQSAIFFKFYQETIFCVLVLISDLSDLLLIGMVTCRRVRVTIMTGSSLDDWIYWHFGYNPS
jgi:hypothetical protein